MVTRKPTAAPRSRKKATPAKMDSFDLDGNRIDKCYCRRCQRQMVPSKFLEATDTLLDRNGKMSVCSECIDDLFDKIFSVENDLSKTILRLCRMLNVVYLDTAVQSTISHASTMYNKNGKMPPVFGYYKAKVTSMAALNSTGILTFSEPGIAISDTPLNPDDVEGGHDAIAFWGDGLSLEDYTFLEREFADWKKTHKSDTKAEITLLKEICFVQLDIRKKRTVNGTTGVGAELKLLQDLMKTASVDPAKASMANTGKSQDTFSSFIKTIEETEPADYYKDKELFKDFDNIEWYFDKYVRRPLKNFVMNSRDFNVSEDDTLKEEEEDGEIDPLTFLLEDKENGSKN